MWNWTFSSQFWCKDKLFFLFLYFFLSINCYCWDWFLCGIKLIFVLHHAVNVLHLVLGETISATVFNYVTEEYVHKNVESIEVLLHVNPELVEQWIQNESSCDLTVALWQFYLLNFHNGCPLFWPPLSFITIWPLLTFMFTNNLVTKLTWRNYAEQLTETSRNVLSQSTVKLLE